MSMVVTRRPAGSLLEKLHHVLDAPNVTLRQTLKPSSHGKLRKDRPTLRALPTAWNIDKLVGAPPSFPITPINY
ncbi:hypothetical protein ANCDUO_26271 [Ancylostoma duodenale]|uniref:Uncharacterized protein n=1 Tax=Ancylostoma duodenale TaxID=51022 RepID=A0A0C2FA09_9BILA|nr:hypothetical protein ANCDUO_26271 [Ancylostoma duodenale]